MTPRKLLEQYDRLLEKHGSQRAVAKKLGIPRTTIQEWLKDRQRILFSETSPKDAVHVKTPARGVKRFIFTSAQDDTAVHEGFLSNLEAYAEHMGAELIIAGFTYDKRLYEEHRKDEEFQNYHPRVRRYMQNQRMEIGPNLMFCGEMNTLPTAVSPLTGFETYTRQKWGIFPHAKVQLVSVPTMKHYPAKQIMTTGAVTKPNYVQKRAGIRAHFHHVYGAVIVEIDASGDHFCRHLLGEKGDGSFHDLNNYVEDGAIYEDCAVEAITWGDIHFEKMDPDVARACFGLDLTTMRVTEPTSMLDALEPAHQFFHDVTDFSVRNHHNIKDPHFRVRMFYNGTDSVERSLDGVADFLDRTRRPWCQSVVVESNHDLALLRWLKEAEWKHDPVNAEFYLRAQLACVQAIRDNRSFCPLEWVLKESLTSLDSIRFLREDESYTICDDKIEGGMHGHLGANGSKGSPRQFTRMGPKANTGHTHSASILDGIYTGGTSSNLDMGFNKGLSSWSHTHIVTYPNGKRTLVTLQNGKWRA
jgi:hypothetical protein